MDVLVAVCSVVQTCFLFCIVVILVGAGDNS